MKLHDLMLCQAIVQEFLRLLQIKLIFYVTGLIYAFFLIVLITHFMSLQSRVEVGKIVVSGIALSDSETPLKIWNPRTSMHGSQNLFGNTKFKELSKESKAAFA